jgi:hypothetical protein
MKRANHCQTHAFGSLPAAASSTCSGIGPQRGCPLAGQTWPKHPGSSALLVTRARVAWAWPPLLPHRGQMERLRQEDLTELAAVHLDGRSRIECAAKTLLGKRVAGGGYAGRHPVSTTRMGDGRLQGLGAPTQRAANADCSKQLPPGLMDAASELGRGLTDR